MKLRFVFGLFPLLVALVAGPVAIAAGPRVMTCTVPVTRGWYLTPDTETLVLTSPKTGELVYFDVLAGKEQKRVAVPFKPASITGQRDLLFVSVEGGNVVQAVKLATGEKVREYRLPGEPVQALATHPESGAVFASNLEEEIFSLSSDSNQVTKTTGRGMFLCVDQTDGKFLFAGTNRPSQDVLEFQRTASGGLQVQRVTVSETAVVSKYAINGAKLKLVASNPNTAVGFGGYLHLSPDGKKFVMVAGGGWRSPTNQTTRFDMAVFDADSPDTMLGGLEAGGPQTIAFHPVLPIGVAQGANYDYYLFDAESLIVRQQWKLKPAAVNFWQNLATFGGRGSVFISQQGESLQFFVLDLTEPQQATLAKRYGKLPKYPDALPIETAQLAVASKGTSLPAKTDPSASAARPTAPGGKPGMTAKGESEPVGNRVAPTKTPVKLPDGSDLSLAAATKRVPYIGDRDYMLIGLPKELKESTVLVRDSNRTAGWPSKGTVIATQDCTVYLAVMHQINSAPVVDKKLLAALIEEGWTVEKNGITTTSAEKETWQWKLFSKRMTAGPLTLSSRVGLRAPAQAVYFFR